MQKSDIIPNLNEKVIYDNSEYIFEEYRCKKSKLNGQIIHIAVLMDKNGNSRLNVPVEDVKAKEKNQCLNG